MTHDSADFSFDVYPGLDRELDAVYQRNLEQGLASGEVVAAVALQTTIDQELQHTVPPGYELETDEKHWVMEEFASRGGEHTGRLSWVKYEAVGGFIAQTSYDDLVQTNPNINEKLSHLYRAREALKGSGEVTPEGKNIGEELHLITIPWQAMRDKLETFPDWVKAMRTEQGLASSIDYFDDQLLNLVTKETGSLYRDPRDPKTRMSAKRYLDLRIEQDGPWGVMLAQTSIQAGLERLVKGSPSDRTPNTLTNNGDENLMVAGQAVDAMGIFEWIALSLQENPTRLSSGDLSWLLANRIEDANGDARVPFGDWGGGRVGSRVYSAGNGNGIVRPRLAVISPIGI